MTKYNNIHFSQNEQSNFYTKRKYHGGAFLRVMYLL